MATVLAITNQKGGVGKTTTALNIGVRLKMLGYTVLLVDMDAQNSLSLIMQADTGKTNIYNILLDKNISAEEAIQKTPEGDIIPGSPMINSLDIVLTQVGKEYRLKEVLSGIRDSYDYIILDGPPTLGIATINMLAAADKVIIPSLADIFSLQGIGQLYDTIKTIREYCNPQLVIEGILIIRQRKNLKLDRFIKEQLEQVAEAIGTKVFDAFVRESVVIREAEANRNSIFAYAPKSRQAEDYARVTDEFLGQTAQEEESTIPGMVSNLPENNV